MFCCDRKASAEHLARKEEGRAFVCYTILKGPTRESREEREKDCGGSKAGEESVSDEQTADITRHKSIHIIP